MTEQRSKRKLTAIFSTDVKGYSRLMADDEEAISICKKALGQNPDDLAVHITWR